MATIKDERTPEEVKITQGFVIATDKFMSGWGQAQGKSVIAVPFKDDQDMNTILSRVERRNEMKRIRIVYGSEYKPRLSANDHLHIYDIHKSFRYSL